MLVDLRRRLAETRWEYGADIGAIRQLAHYWEEGFDWRAAEAGINRFAQFTTEIDGQAIHFIHERSPRADAIPLMLMHGWPGSIVEFLALIEPLTHPKDGSTPAFDVTIPSLPGFGFSGPARTGGWGTVRMAKALVILMDRLGYSRYGVQGGDWSSTIAQQMAHEAPTRMIGIHLDCLPVQPPSQDALARISTQEHALAASPVGWLAWSAVHCHDLANSGDFQHTVDRDTFLTDVTLYWVTGTVGSSMRIYREQQLSVGDSTLPRLKTPVGYAAAFPKGDFCSLEQSTLLLHDIRQFFARIN